MDWVMITALAQSASALVAAVAIFLTVRLQQKQMRLHEGQLKLQARQMLLERRQLLLPLHGYLQGLKDVDPGQPVWRDMVEAVNILELVAVCWEGQLIDENIIRRMYRQSYLRLYRNIDEVKKNPDTAIPIDGHDLLMGSPAVIKLYQTLLDEHVNKDKLTPV